MKQTLIVTAIILFNTSLMPLFGQQTEFVSDYLERLENSRKYLKQVAELMPAGTYSFKATEASLSFEENLLHIAYALDWHSQSLLGGRESRNWQTDTVFKVANYSKAQMIALVDKTFLEAIQLIEQFDSTKLNDELDYFGLTRSKRQIFLLLADHITHHRGQMLVYLRLKGIVPPRYVLFQ